MGTAILPWSFWITNAHLDFEVDEIFHALGLCSLIVHGSVVVLHRLCINTVALVSKFGLVDPLWFDLVCVDNRLN